MNRYGTWVDTPAYAHTRAHRRGEGGGVVVGQVNAEEQLWQPNVDDGGQQQQFKESTNGISTTASAFLLFTEYMHIKHYSKSNNEETITLKFRLSDS